jgi:hypothetical protein
LVLVKNNLLYILFIFISSFTNEGFAFQTETTFAIQDTLVKDYSNLEPKQFEDLSEKYNGPEFIYERTASDLSWWTRLKMWLSEVIKDLFGITSKGQASKAVDYIITIAGIIITLLVIYFIFKAIINKEGRWVFGKSSDKSIIPNVSIEQNIHETNFKDLVASAEKEDNYRLVIRYYYLWLLKELAQKEVIEYDVEKTNRDYQYEIKNEQLYKKFTYTSYLYNYIWYGEFNIDQAEFLKSKTAFINFLNDLK